MNIFELYEKYLEKKERKETHSDGTYISAQLSKVDSKNLYEWCLDNKIPNLADPEQYHATIIYSRKGIPEVKTFKFDTPITASIEGWDIFPTQTGGKCLVARLESSELTKYHKTIMSEYKATFDYDSYKPHITVSYDYDKNSPPKECPKDLVVFSKVEVKALDPQFEPKKASK